MSKFLADMGKKCLKFSYWDQSMSVIRRASWRPGVWPVSIMYLWENFKNLLPKPVIRIENNLVEMVTTKIAKRNLIRQKTLLPRGVASFYYVPKGKL